MIRIAAASRLPLKPRAVDFAHRWIGIVNAKAGKGQGPEVARKLGDRLQARSGIKLSFYETAASTEQRLQEITENIVASRPTEERPTGVVAFGGDGTCNDMMDGILNFIFPDLTDLLTSSPDAVFDRMMAGGIHAGTLGLGSAKDLASLYGAPSRNVARVLEYLGEPRPKHQYVPPHLAPLNLGYVRLFDRNGDVLRDKVFCHSMSAGPTIAGSFNQTQDMRGPAARRERQKIVFKKTWADPDERETMLLRWERPHEAARQIEVIEAVARAVVRTDRVAGFPGQIQPGLGLTFFPNLKFREILNIYRECLWRAVPAEWGDASRIMPDQYLKTLSPHHQMTLAGQDREQMTWRFFSKKEEPIEVPVQVSGDYLQHAHKIELYALPPFPNFLTGKRSLMASLFTAIDESGHGAAPENT